VVRDEFEAQAAAEEAGERFNCDANSLRPARTNGPPSKVAAASSQRGTFAA
jgi:hypothetical protein